MAFGVLLFKHSQLYEFLKNKIMMVFVQVYIKWRVNELNITASNASFNAGTAMQNHYTLNYTLKRIRSLADAESTRSNGFFCQDMTPKGRRWFDTSSSAFKKQSFSYNPLMLQLISHIGRIEKLLKRHTGQNKNQSKLTYCSTKEYRHVLSK